MSESITQDANLESTASGHDWFTETTTFSSLQQALEPEQTVPGQGNLYFFVSDDNIQRLESREDFMQTLEALKHKTASLVGSNLSNVVLLSSKQGWLNKLELPKNAKQGAGRLLRSLWSARNSGSTEITQEHVLEESTTSGSRVFYLCSSKDWSSIQTKASECTVDATLIFIAVACLISTSVYIFSAIAMFISKFTMVVADYLYTLLGNVLLVLLAARLVGEKEGWFETKETLQDLLRMSSERFVDEIMGVREWVRSRL